MELTPHPVSKMLPVPDHWPARYNACTEPCDFVVGPCCCGAFHHADEPWVHEWLAMTGDTIAQAETWDQYRARQIAAYHDHLRDDEYYEQVGRNYVNP